MKKAAGIFFVAVAGGLAALGIDKLTEREDGARDPVASYRVEEPVAMPVAGRADALADLTLAAERSLHAVVHIRTAQAAENYQYYDPFRDLFYERPQRMDRPQRIGQGSGVIVSEDGYIITNNHVVAGAEKIEVALNDKRTFSAEIVGSDPATDLALLKVDGKDLPFIIYGNSDHLKVGEWVLAVGNPFNLTSTVTAGIVSAKARNINILSDQFALESFIQTDAAVNPGNSGGALVNTEGRLVGVNTAIKSNTGSYTGYSFAVPVNIVRKVIDDLLRYGEVQRAFIGVSIRDMDEALAGQTGAGDLRGVYVAGLTENGAAKEAGIREGDIILRIGATEVNNVPELQEQVGRFHPGDRIAVTLKRSGKVKRVEVVLKNKEGHTGVLRRSELKGGKLCSAGWLSAIVLNSGIIYLPLRLRNSGDVL